MKGHHDIYIVKVGNEYRVRPAVWSSDGQETDEPDGHGGSQKVKASLRIRNLTAMNVLVVLPTAIVDAGDGRIPLGPAGTPQSTSPNDSGTVKLKKKVGGDAAGVYPYSVIVYDPNGASTAVGESDPVVIIDPPPL